jgi:hypothetical protein
MGNITDYLRVFYRLFEPESHPISLCYLLVRNMHFLVKHLLLFVFSLKIL